MLQPSMALFPNIPRQVKVLGWVSFFTDLASEMLYPLIPIFLVTLGLTTEMLGVLEGVAEGISTGLRWIGGVLSDISGRRKPFVWWGYTLSALAKPIMGLAAAWGWGALLLGRSVDRFGKSIRTAARDALIADAAPPEQRGLAFGFHRAMDTAGAVLGPLLALGVLLCWQDRIRLEYLFYLALLPGLASSLLVLVGVKESARPAAPEEARKKTRFWQSYPRAFWQLLLATTLFSLGNSSDTLLILRAGEVFTGINPNAGGKSLPELLRMATFATALFAGYNLVYALLATPAGKLSDQIARKKVIALGWVVYAAVYAGFAFMPHGATTGIVLLFCAYGIYQAFTEGVTKALIADHVPAAQRAGAIGLFAMVAGLGQLAASILTGWLWVRYGASWAFLTGTIFPLLALPLVLAVPGKSGSEQGA